MKKNNKTVDQWLDEVNYGYLNSNSYVPSPFSLQVLSFIKRLNTDGAINKTPAVHLAMLDKLVTRKGNFLVNLAHRGLAKTTLFGEYLPLYLAVFHELPKLGYVNFMMYIAGSVENGAKSLRQNLENRYWASSFLQKMLPPSGVKFTDSQIEFTNIKGQKFMIKLFGVTSGIRGQKAYGDRPQLCVIDDVFTDEAARSQAVRDVIKDTVYNGVMNAMDPQRCLVVLNGTPFNKQDILIEAIESGAWDVNVYPICERFPCSKDEFKGSWPDRFSYDFVKQRYEFAVANGKKSSFFQELMLRLTSEEDRLVQDSDICWYERSMVMRNRENFNIFITTDFATSDKETADYSVISVWAVSPNGDWFWLDGICKKQTMDANIEDLFTFVVKYYPVQSVGVEVTGQQGAFLAWLKKEMAIRNIFFNFATSINSNLEGIRPTTDKLSRFNLVVPLFKLHKINFPLEIKESPIMTEFLTEIGTVTADGIKGHDDCLDTISMLTMMKTWTPTGEFAMNAFIKKKQKDNSLWDPNLVEYDNNSNSRMDSYVV